MRHSLICGDQPPHMAPALDRLLAIMVQLRDPEHGCLWDREQEFATIAPYTIEEAYEVADAIARGDVAALKDELGDLLFQVVFHARMAEEAGLFGFADVAAAIADKMVRRHPHVFGDAEVASAAAQTTAWEEHKASERAARAAAAGTPESVLDGVALALPALLRAAKIQQRAARIGFDWPAARPVIAKITEEVAELEAELDGGGDGAADPARIADEMGDILFAAANLARKLDIDPEAALRRATAKFERRFRALEARAAERGTGADLDALEALWQQVKSSEKPLRLESVVDALPPGFDTMREEARGEGHRMLDTLATQWAAGVERFSRHGEALLAVYANGALAGIGGITHESAIPGALRMRRFYVRVHFRRNGIARNLAAALLEPHAGKTITVNAGAGSDRFWEALGFAPDRRLGHTHIRTG
jgi:nucleoside triphosphate diphosphatase